MRVCLIAIASGEYIHYLPLWRFFASRAYPEYELFTEIVHQPVKYHAACVRFLCEPPMMADYYYITDADMFIMRERPTLAEYHISEMQRTGLCYSNSPRSSEPRGPERFTGLHFCIPQWYEKTAGERCYWMNKLLKGEFGGDFFDDEIMLKKICEDSNVGMPPECPNLLERHHGIHIGTVRHYPDKAFLQSAMINRCTVEQAKQYQEAVADPTFVAIYEKTKESSPKIAAELDWLDGFTKRRSKM